MRSRANKLPKSKRNTVFAIVLGIVWGVLIVLYTRCIYSIYNYKEEVYHPKIDYIADEVLKEQYGSLYSRMDSIMRDGVNRHDNPEYTELIAVHDYLEAAALYRMYKENGLKVEADRYLERMNAAKVRLGELDFSAGEMDGMLGIE